MHEPCTRSRGWYVRHRFLSEKRVWGKGLIWSTEESVFRSVLISSGENTCHFPIDDCGVGAASRVRRCWMSNEYITRFEVAMAEDGIIGDRCKFFIRYVHLSEFIGGYEGNAVVRRLDWCRRNFAIFVERFHEQSQEISRIFGVSNFGTTQGETRGSRGGKGSNGFGRIWSLSRAAGPACWRSSMNTASPSPLQAPP